MDFSLVSLEARPVAKTWVPSYQSSLLTAVSAVPNLASDNSVSVEIMGEQIMLTNESGKDLEFSLADRKLFDFIMCWLCRFNSQRHNDDLNDSILFMLDEYLTVMGLTLSHENRSYYFDLIIDGLKKWSKISLTDGVSEITTLVSRRGVVGFAPSSVDLTVAEKRAEARDAIIEGKACFGVRFDKCVLEHLDSMNRRLMPYYVGLFKLVERNENAYSIARYLLLNYSYRASHQGPRSVVVGDLLAVCPEMRSSRNDNLKRQFEAAMNALSREDRVTKSGERVPPLIRWCYKNKKKMLFEKWKKSEILFELVGYDYDNNRLGSLIKKTKALEFAGNKIIDV